MIFRLNVLEVGKLVPCTGEDGNTYNLPSVTGVGSNLLNLSNIEEVKVEPEAVFIGEEALELFEVTEPSPLMAVKLTFFRMPVMDGSGMTTRRTEFHKYAILADAEKFLANFEQQEPYYEEIEGAEDE